MSVGGQCLRFHGRAMALDTGALHTTGVLLRMLPAERQKRRVRADAVRHAPIPTGARPQHGEPRGLRGAEQGVFAHGGPESVERMYVHCGVGDSARYVRGRRGSGHGLVEGRNGPVCRCAARKVGGPEAGEEEGRGRRGVDGAKA